MLPDVGGGQAVHPETATGSICFCIYLTLFEYKYIRNYLNVLENIWHYLNIFGII